MIYQLDGLLRPAGICKLKISLHDISNIIIYLNIKKTGNNSIILTPKMIEAYKNYLPYRIQPKRKKDEDKLIIIDKGSHYGIAPVERSDFIWRKTKKKYIVI